MEQQDFCPFLAFAVGKPESITIVSGVSHLISHCIHISHFTHCHSRGQFLKQLANGLASARKQLRVVFLRRLWTLCKFSLTSTGVANGFTRAVVENGPLANHCLRNWLQA